MATHRYTLPLPHPADAGIVSARLWAAGAIGVWERADEIVAWFPAPDAADVPPGGTWEVEPDRDWQAEWKASIRPVRAGRVCVVPSWLADEHQAQRDEVTIVLDPGRAFGTGHHATTALCLELLQEVGDLAGARVLDVGTGTGILAIAAARLGAREVVGVDVDRDAVEVARSNATAAGVDLELAVGTVDDAPSGCDLVMANLVTDTLIELARGLVGALRMGGTLIVSGIAAGRERPVIDVLAGVGLGDLRVVERDGWTAVSGTRRPRPTDAGRARASRWTAGVLAGLLWLTACAESIPEAESAPPTTPPAEAAARPSEADPLTAALDAEVQALIGSVQTSRDLLQAAWEAPDLDTGRDAARQALAALTAHEGLTGGIAAPGVAPLFPGPVSSREEPVDYGDAFTRTLTAARAAGPAGGKVTDLLRDPVAGDIGAWQRDAEGQLEAVRETVDEATGAAIVDAEVVVNRLEGEGTRALAWAVLAAEAGDLDRLNAFGERGVAHLDLILVAFTDGPMEGPPGAGADAETSVAP